jgi:tetratricopeptide (TPR) repeat protein
MGCVYRASDSLTGQRVALKLLHAVTSPDVAYRFNREAVLLAELRHPAIVSYVAHGLSEGRQPFLAMEWLDGVDLAHLLSRGPLEVRESVLLLRRAAEALAAAHQQGIVHRDIKPSNLFLRSGRLEDVVVLDFGLARHAEPTLVGVTGSDAVLGTPGYMAPEQASSQPDIRPSADIFSLGCVFYECLTGKQPFAAPHFAAVLAKILFAEPAPLHTLRPGLPAGLQVLLERMLDKNAWRRLPDATSLLASISALESVPELLLPRTAAGAPPGGMAGAEPQLVGVLLVSLQATGEPRTDVARGPALRDFLRTALVPHGARVELLANGSLAATLVPERGIATDQAVLAARCALSLKERCPEAAVVLTTGRGVLREHLPVGEAMDRAGHLLRQVEQTPGASGLIVLDEVTAGLLDPGFHLSRSPWGAFQLHGERLGTDESRPLLGRPTPCVGREQELALLELTFDSCVEEPGARALLMVAPPGVGKSRLRHEFLRRLEQRGKEVLVLFGRGDAMSAGSACGLLGQALRRLCGIVDGEELELRRERLARRVSRHLPPAQVSEVVEFLGELCAIPFPDEGSPRLRAARGDPRTMSTWLGRAVVAFLQAECAHHPVLLLLEDLHWGDPLTLKLVDEALRELAEHPLLVLALARPEVKERFPGLWERGVQEVPLRGLSRKASARLVREVLGPEVTGTTVERLVEQSAGNALFLEELIRSVAEGRGDAPPETVLAMLRARLQRLEPGARRVLLAASIFGRTFWEGGVRALRGQEESREGVEQWLRQLVELELIIPQPTRRFPHEPEYRFRHALVWDAARGLLPDGFEPTGHLLAGEWLEQTGESEPLVLAEHYQRGQRFERALHFHLLAAEQLYERYDVQGTLRCIQAALACAPGAEALVRLRTLQSLAALGMGELSHAYELGAAVLPEVKPGSRSWCRLVHTLLLISTQFGRLDHWLELNQALLRTTPAPEAISAYVVAAGYSVATAIWSGLHQEAVTFLERTEQVASGAAASEPLVRGWLDTARGLFHYALTDKPWRTLALARQGHQTLLEVGEERTSTAAQNVVGMALAALGDVHGGVAQLQESESRALRLGDQLLLALARMTQLLVLALSPEEPHRQQARVLAKTLVEAAPRNVLLIGLAHAVLAKVAVNSRDWHEAQAHAHKASSLLTFSLTNLVFARSCLGAALLGQGQATQARQCLEQATRELESAGGAGPFAIMVHRTLAEACFAQGDTEAGARSLHQALRSLRMRANDIPDSATRERFLRHVPENVRTLELARQHLGEALE